MTSAEDQAKGIGDQLNKAKGEIDGLVSSLEGSAVDQATLDQLKATSQALDDIVPDQVVNPEPPADQPPADQPTA
jgi:DNA-binding FrmR family transcriptional regulator